MEQQTTQNAGDNQSSLLMDKEWERIQAKTFTAWTNSHLRRKGAHIDDVRTGLRDGKNLALLLEVISKETLPRPERGNLRVHHVSNVNKCLNFVTSKGVKLVGIAGEEIVDGNEKMTLGMIWTIILRFTLQDIEGGMSAKDGLLLWVQRKTKNYSDAQVTNFTTSWRSGLPFCALIHRHRPELLDYHNLNRSDPKTCLEEAFRVAEQHLDIPKMLDAEDVMLPYPDEKSIVTYVSCYYHAFLSSQGVESAIKRLQNALAKHAEYNRLRSEYEDLSSKLLEWIKHSTANMVDRTVEEDTAECFNNKMNSYHSHVSDDKPKWAKEKQAIQCKLNTLQTMLRVNKHPEYVPPEHLNMGTINKSWDKLEDEERNRFEWINCNLKRQRSIDNLVKRFNHLCSISEAFISNSKGELSVVDYKNELGPLMARQHKHESFCEDVAFRCARIKNIKEVHDKLSQLNYCKIGDCTKRQSFIQDKMTQLKQDSDTCTTTIKALVEKAQQLDNARLEYSKSACAFKNECTGYLDDADDSHSAESVADVKKLQQEHQTNVQLFNALKSKLDNVEKLDSKVKQMCSSPNPYTSITCDQLKNDYDRLMTLSRTRTQTLESVLSKQMKAEELQSKLAVLSKEVHAWYEPEKARILGFSGTMEEQKEKLKAAHIKIDDYYKVKLPQLKDIVTEVNNTQSHVDRHYVTSIEDSFTELSDIVASAENVIENQLLIRDSSLLTEAQIAEFQQLFKKLDKFNNNYLNHDDFRNLLVALDLLPAIVETEDDPQFAAILDKCDVNRTGQVTFSSFLGYMAEQNDNNNEERKIAESFKLLADGKPYITIEKLRAELPEYADACAQSMQVSTAPGAPPGALDYSTYCPNVNGVSDL